MKTTNFAIILAVFLVGRICNPHLQGVPFIYHWEIDETPEGSESARDAAQFHHAVVRFVTDNGADRYALERVLQERYAVSIRGVE